MKNKAALLTLSLIFSGCAIQSSTPQIETAPAVQAPRVFNMADVGRPGTLAIYKDSGMVEYTEPSATPNEPPTIVVYPCEKYTTIRMTEGIINWLNEPFDLTPKNMHLLKQAEAYITMFENTNAACNASARPAPYETQQEIHEALVKARMMLNVVKIRVHAQQQNAPQP